ARRDGGKNKDCSELHDAIFAPVVTQGRNSGATAVDCEFPNSFLVTVDFSPRWIPIYFANLRLPIHGSKPMSFAYSAMDYLRLYPGAFVAVSVLFGLVFGSFLNVVIFRLPVMMARDWWSQCAEWYGESHDPSLPAKTPPDGTGNGHGIATPGIAGIADNEPFNLMFPRSHCPHCGHTLSILENIPLVSFLWLRGRCAACHSPIGPRYPLVESLSAVMAGAVAWRLGFGIQALSALILTWTLIVLAFIDLDHRQLPDEITLPLLWLGLAFNLFAVHVPVADAVIGAILGYGILWAVYHAFRLLTGKEGMGYGDFKLLAMAGAWLGWQGLPAIVLISSVAGATVGIALILLRGHDRNVPIPFGPYLAMAVWIVLLWGNDPMIIVGNPAG
ncbi:MAG: type 4 prepilin peptidase 1 Aspartic peptidase. MEROPS family A24A, partial [Candidatus Kentron sp. G]